MNLNLIRHCWHVYIGDRFEAAHTNYELAIQTAYLRAASIKKPEVVSFDDVRLEWTRIERERQRGTF